MNKQVTIKIDIYEILEFKLSHKERMNLIDFMLYDLSNDDKYKKKFKQLIKTELETELEFGKNKELIKAYRTILKLK